LRRRLRVDYSFFFDFTTSRKETPLSDFDKVERDIGAAFFLWYGHLFYESQKGKKVAIGLNRIIIYACFLRYF